MLPPHFARFSGPPQTVTGSAASIAGGIIDADCDPVDAINVSRDANGNREIERGIDQRLDADATPGDGQPRRQFLLPAAASGGACRGQVVHRVQPDAGAAAEPGGGFDGPDGGAVDDHHVPGAGLAQGAECLGGHLSGPEERDPLVFEPLEHTAGEVAHGHARDRHPFPPEGGLRGHQLGGPQGRREHLPLPVAVFTAGLLEFTPQRLPIVTVSGLLRPNFGVERRAKIVEGSLAGEAKQRRLKFSCSANTNKSMS